MCKGERVSTAQRIWENCKKDIDDSIAGLFSSLIYEADFVLSQDEEYERYENSIESFLCNKDKKGVYLTYDEAHDFYDDITAMVSKKTKVTYVLGFTKGMKFAKMVQDDDLVRFLNEQGVF